MHILAERRLSRPRLLCMVVIPLAALMLACAGCARSAMPSAKDGAARNRAMWMKIGRELAEAVEPLRPDTIVFLRPAPGPQTGEDSEVIEKAFRAEAARASSPPVVKTLLIPAPQSPATEPASLLLSRPTLDATWMDEATRMAGAGGLVVSSLGEPASLPPSGSAWARVVCYSRDGGAGLAEMIRAGVVVAAVAPRHTEPDAGEADWYELRFTTLNLENLASW